MKKQILLIVCLIFCTTIGAAHAETFWTGSVFGTSWVPNVRNFDWSSSGSGSAQGLGPAGAPLTLNTPFTFRYQSYLFALNAPDGSSVPFPGLNTLFEYTVVAEIPEIVLAFNSVGGVNTAAFLTMPGGVFYIYHDASQNASVPSGFGFDDGTLVASGSIDPNQVSTFTYISATGTGIGSTTLRGSVTYANPSFLDPADKIIAFRVESTLNYPPIDSTTAAYFNGRAGEGFLAPYAVAINDLALKVDSSSKFMERTSISCTKFCTGWNPISISAVVTNDGGEPLNNVDCTDNPAIALTGVPVASLAPGSSVTVTGSYFPISNPSTDTLTCSGTGDSGELVTTTCSAECGQDAGQCRMTGGSETLVEDPSYGPTYIWFPGTYALDGNGSVLVTTGGQIGAPMASPTGPSFGEWEHQQHCNKKNGCTGLAFGFNFKAGTASGKAKDTTIINSVLCGDAGWCTQARCAPFKQIFWDGIGLIKNITPTFRLPNGVTCTNLGEESLHYFKAHVGDFGEPGSTNIRKNGPPVCNTRCPWTSGGVDINNIVLLSPVSPAPEPFGSKDGQICPCGCGDWYEINIYCNADSSDPGDIIYTFASFIDTGNFQLHPPVGDHCE